ncbi:MAG: hypothetical protein RR825_02295 [Ruthenibacterium sp.]
MKYHRGERFGLSEKQQSLIYWQCVNYDALPFAMQHRILNLCTEIGADYHQILFKAITTTESLTSISYSTFGTSLPIFDSHLCVMVRKFYDRFASEV